MYHIERKTQRKASCTSSLFLTALSWFSLLLKLENLQSHNLLVTFPVIPTSCINHPQYFSQLCWWTSDLISCSGKVIKKEQAKIHTCFSVCNRAVNNNPKVWGDSAAFHEVVLFLAFVFVTSKLDSVLKAVRKSPQVQKSNSTNNLGSIACVVFAHGMTRQYDRERREKLSSLTLLVCYRWPCSLASCDQWILKETRKRRCRSEHRIIFGSACLCAFLNSGAFSACSAFL